LLKDFHKFLRE
jgi:hypothetical protein